MKYKIYIDEVIKFQHEMIIEVDKDKISDEKLQSILDKAEKEGKQMGWDYISNSLERQNIKCLEIVEDDNGDIDEVEITDCTDCYEN